MGEWSKAADLSCVIFGCVGSNLTSGIYIYIYIFLTRIKIYNNNMTLWPSG